MTRSIWFGLSFAAVPNARLKFSGSLAKVGKTS